MAKLWSGMASGVGVAGLARTHSNQPPTIGLTSLEINEDFKPCQANSYKCQLTGLTFPSLGWGARQQRSH